MKIKEVQKQLSKLLNVDNIFLKVNRNQKEIKINFPVNNDFIVKISFRNKNINLPAYLRTSKIDIYYLQCKPEAEESHIKWCNLLKEIVEQNEKYFVEILTALIPTSSFPQDAVQKTKKNILSSFFFYTSPMLVAEDFLKPEQVIQKILSVKEDLNISTKSVGIRILLYFENTDCLQQCLCCSKTIEPFKISLNSQKPVPILEVIKLLKSYVVPVVKKEFSNIVIQFSGADILNYTDIFKVFDLVEKFNITGFEILSPGNKLADEEFVKQLAKYAKLIKVIVTLFADNPLLNDFISGRKGSFNEMMQGINNMKKYNISFSVNTVLLHNTVEHFSNLLQFNKKIKSKLSAILFNPEGMYNKNKIKAILPNLLLINVVLNKHQKLIKKYVSGFNHFPLCVIPKEIHNLYVQTNFTVTENIKLRICQQKCAYIKYCNGIHPLYLSKFGEKEINYLLKLQNNSAINK